MKQSKVNVSFEFFPPKNEEAISSLWQNINRLEPLKPRFISVTYGAGGSTRENTHNLVKQIKKKTDLQPAAHLTCINSTKKEIEFLEKQKNIRSFRISSNILRVETAPIVALAKLNY